MTDSDRSRSIGFGLNPLDRMSGRRGDDAFVRGLRDRPTARFLLFDRETPVLGAQGREILFGPGRAAALGEPEREVFLGCGQDGTALFARALDPAAVERAGGLAAHGLEAVSLRTLATAGRVAPDLLGELGGAQSVLNWHRRHRHCANCGAPSRVSAAGWRRDCEACGAQHFPRVDPVVIMLATDGQRCLLGRQPRFAPGMYSALAGFLEPGETIEDAVRREILEEAGVACSEVRYFASQPWPFPSSLMIGCFALACGTDIAVDREELEDARWFGHDEVRAMLDGTHAAGLSAPLPYAIAHHLLKAYAEGEMPWAGRL